MLRHITKYSVETLIKSTIEELGIDTVMGDALEALRIVAILCSPAMPDTAQAVWERIGMAGQVADQRLPDSVTWGQYPAGNPVVKGDALFPRIKL